MDRIARAVLLMIVLSMIGLSAARAYPIPPVPLWELVERSEAIVLAEVVGIVREDRPESEDDWSFDRSAASLKILETWKGSVAGEMEVRFPEGLLCPAPPRYVEGKDVVAFLSRNEKGWSTVGLSYGTLYPESREELKNLLTMVHRAIELQKKGKVSPADRLDWLVEAASLPGTRWHGLYELEFGGDEFSSYSDQKGRKAHSLSPAQRQRIARGFVERPPVDFTLPMTLKILAGHADPRVDETAVAALEDVFGEKQLPYWIDQALVLVLERFGDRKAAKRAKGFLKGCCEIDEDKARSAWQSAKLELKIPKVVADRASSRKVRGVGPETPD